MANCGGICAKLMLIIFNILYLAIGGVILGVGIWFKVEPDAFNFDVVQLIGTTVFGNRTFEIAVWVFIAFGAFIFLFGGFGLLAAITESTWMLGLYIIILVVLFALEVAFGVLTLVYKEEIKDDLRVDFNRLVRDEHFYKVNNNTGAPETDAEGNLVPTDAGKVLNFFQVELKCCGIDSYNDYSGANYDFQATYKLNVPYSCCTPKPPADWEQVNNASAVFHPSSCQAMNASTGFTDRPCFERAERWLEEREVIVIGIAFGVAVFQIFGFIFAVCLCVVSRQKRDE